MHAFTVPDTKRRVTQVAKPLGASGTRADNDVAHAEEATVARAAAVHEIGAPRLHVKPNESSNALLLQRKCACGATVSGQSGECEDCRKKRSAGLQTKFAVSEPSDTHEQEADRVAGAGRFAPGTQEGRRLIAHELKHVIQQSGSDIIPASQSLEEEYGRSRNPSPSLMASPVHRKAGGAGQVAEGNPTDHEVLRSRGQSLDAVTRNFMERQFDRDFSGIHVYRGGECIRESRRADEAEAEWRATTAITGATPTGSGARADFSAIRVHSGPAAAVSAQAHGAAAYALGHHLVFAHDRYRPETVAGLRLLAHELVHAVQQGRTRRHSLDRFEARVHESVERTALTEGGVMTNEEASAVYFGNWMRDMNQVFVPLLTHLLPPDVLFSLIAYLAATKFGRELTPEQFGYYIPAEHLDNPAGLVAVDDLLPSQPAVSAAARPQAPGRLGAGRPAHLDTPQEDVAPTAGTVQGVNIFAVDQAGVMAFIRRTNLHIERRLQLASDAGRNPDGMHHFGAAQHAVEDLFAHSNYIEIAVDRLLRTDATFLAQLTDADRQVFTYSQRVRIGAGGAAAQRAVLTTGTFTGTDTQISIASEVVGVLSRPLPDPATQEEQRAQDRFMVALLRAFEARLRTNPELQRAVREAFRRAGVPAPLADRADQMPLADIYQAQTFMRIPIPDAIRIPLKRQFRDIVSREVLQPAAGQVQAAGLEARVADTSLICVLRESQRQERGEFSAADRESMRQRERLTQRTVAQQETDTRAAGARRAQAIQGTPIHVVAGPSHSQIAKDHPNSPFFGLAFLLANAAVQRLRDRMLAAWTERHGAPTTPFNFDWASYPQAPPGTAAGEADVYEGGRRLYHVGRAGRGSRERESLQRGREILTQGGAPGQPYDLAAMRHQAADRIRTVAEALRATAGAPDASATAIGQVRSFVGRMVPEVEQRLRRQLTQAQAAAAAAGASQQVADINTVANTLFLTAAAVETARRHPQRESANAALVQRRQEMLAALARRPGLDVGLGAALLYTLDEEIQATAVTYASEQRTVLEGRQTVAEMGASPRGLTVSQLTLPPVTGSAAMTALLNEARLVVGHPYENSWWETHVRDYARRFPARLVNDIEARNEGVPHYRGT